MGLIPAFSVGPMDAQNVSSCKVVGSLLVIERRSMGVIFDLRSWLRSFSDILE